MFFHLLCLQFMILTTYWLVMKLKLLKVLKTEKLKQLFLIWILRIHRGYIVFLFGIVCKQCVRFLFL